VSHEDPYDVVTQKMIKDCSDVNMLPLDIVELLYPLAYEYGHSYGIGETSNYLHDLCEVTDAVLAHMAKKEVTNETNRTKKNC
jgi:hypothetical protein